MEKRLDKLIEELRTTDISSIEKRNFSDYDSQSVDCESGYCITGECTCEC